MKVTADMKVKEVLELGEHLLSAFVWLAPELERLQYPKLRRAMSGRVSVAQAARIARIPLTEALYVLNLAAGADSEELADELKLFSRRAFEYEETNPPCKPPEIVDLKDDHPKVRLIDVMEEADRRKDPLPKIVRGLVALETADEVLLVQHPFDPIPLRDMFARRGFASWAEERTPGHWFIYFYHPQTFAEAVAYPPIEYKVYVKAAFA